MVRDNTVARLRQLVAATLVQRCTLQVETSGTDAYGSPTHIPQTVATDVPCRIIMAGSSTQGAGETVGEREREGTQYRLILAWGTAVSTDTLVISGEVKYRVTRVDNQLTDAVDVRATIVRDDE